MRKQLIVAGLGVAQFAAAAGASIIYDSTRLAGTPVGILLVSDFDETDSRVELPGAPNEREFDSRTGDVITFGGTDRLVTEFRVHMWAFTFPAGPAVTADVELSIYENVGNLPGALLWTGTREGMSFARSANVTTPVDFFPNVVLPDSVCFGIAFGNIVNPAPGAPFGVAADQLTPRVGSSTPNVIAQVTSTGMWEARDYGPTWRNVSARVTAVPVPAPGAAGVLLLGVWPCVRHRR